MVIMQHDDDSINDEALKMLCTDQANPGGYFLFNTRGHCAKQDLSWETSLGFWTNLLGLIRSFAEAGEEVHLHYESARQIAEAVVESALLDFNEQDGHNDRTEVFYGLAESADWITGERQPPESRMNQPRAARKVVSIVPIRNSDRSRVRPTSSVARTFSPRGQVSSGRSAAT